MITRPIAVSPQATEAFFRRTEKTDSCWLWRGRIHYEGYGIMPLGERRVLAHRYAYTAFRGDIPTGLTLDHLCRVRYCVNPDHLEAVTTQVNTLRGDTPVARALRKTACKDGHPLDGVQLSRGRPTRYCRTCARIRNRRANKARRGRRVA